MPFTFEATTVAAGAPNIEAGMYDARFDGIEKKYIEGGQFGDGDRLEWQFTLFQDGEPLYDEGEIVEVSGLTSLSTNVASKTTPKAVRYLKALMTPEEFSAFEAGGKAEAASLIGRMVQVQVEIKGNGWPTIANVVAAPRRRG